MFRTILPACLSLTSLLSGVHASPLAQLWSHQASHCIPGVADELCQLAKISETPRARQARAQLEALKGKYQALPSQEPAYRSLLFLATEQSRMEANGSGATDSPEDPDGSKLEALRTEAIRAFQGRPQGSLPYLSLPLLKVIGSLPYRDPERHRVVTDWLLGDTLAKEKPLGRLGASFLALLAAHRASYDGPGALRFLSQARESLGRGVLARELEVGLWLQEATIRGDQRHWDGISGSDFGIEALIRALVLLAREKKISAEVFRAAYERAESWLGFRRTWIQKQGRWTPEAEAKAWQAEAMFELLRAKRPKDIPRSK